MRCRRRARKSTGTANVWASMSVDPEHGILYLPVSSPSPNFYGGNRKEKLPLGHLGHRARRRYRQGDVEPPDRASRHLGLRHQFAADAGRHRARTARRIPALVQSTKMGFLFVLNRLTGEPIYPIEERRCRSRTSPASSRRRRSPMRRRRSRRCPTAFPAFRPRRHGQLRRVQPHASRTLRYDGRYTPPSVKGSLAYPSTAGGVEWGGGAVDPAQRHLCRQQFRTWRRSTG